MMRKLKKLNLSLAMHFKEEQNMLRLADVIGKTPKPFAHIYVDDRAICAYKDIEDVYRKLIQYADK